MADRSEPSRPMEGTSGGPFGQRVPRVEDARLLTGRGRYVADVRLSQDPFILARTPFVLFGRGS